MEYGYGYSRGTAHYDPILDKVFYLIAVDSKLGLIINSLVINSVPLITSSIHYCKISWNVIGINRNNFSANSGKYCSHLYFVYGKE